MPDDGFSRMHTVIACPVCAKNGNGRGAVQSYYNIGETDCLYCAFCGWKGDYNTVQTYNFPCTSYTVVEIDLSILENILSFALDFPERLTIKLPFGARTGQVLENFVDRSFVGEPLEEWDVRTALFYLVAKGWLYPAFYKVEVDV